MRVLIACEESQAVTLEPTDLLEGVELAHRVHEMPPGPERARLRSKTYTGVARAMAEQWAESA